MRDDHHELSPAGARRRDRMLPLLQDAVRERGERRRRRRTIASALLVFAATIGLLQLMQGGPSRSDESDPRLAAENVVPPADVIPPAGSGIDIRPVGPSRLYARLQAADPEVSIRTPDALPDSHRIEATGIAVRRITTEELMDELAAAGFDHAVICSEVECRLFLAEAGRDTGEEDGQDRVRGT